jgi:hypothetical protein
MDQKNHHSYHNSYTKVIAAWRSLRPRNVKKHAVAIMPDLIAEEAKALWGMKLHA